MYLDTRQKVLITTIVILLMVLTWQISLIIKIKSQGGHFNIPFIHEDATAQKVVATANNNTAAVATVTADPQTPNVNAVTHLDQKNTTSNQPTTSLNNASSAGSAVNTSTANSDSASSDQNSPATNTAQSAAPVDASSQNTTGVTLNDADKQYIQSLITTQINNRLTQNETAITMANTNAANFLAQIKATQASAMAAQAAATAAQEAANERLTKDEAAIALANSSSNKALADSTVTIAAINDRLTKDEAAIAAANKVAAQALAAVTNSSAAAASLTPAGLPGSGVSGAAQGATTAASSVAAANQTTDASAGAPSQTSNTAAQSNTGAANSSPSSASTINQSNPSSLANNASVAPQTQVPVTNPSPSPSNPVAAPQPAKVSHHIRQLPGIYGKIMRANPASYTIQLIADSGVRSLYEYMSAYCLGYAATPLHTRHLGKNWYVLIYGHFDTVYQARVALQQFPYAALKWQPFVRRMSDVQRIIANSRGEDSLASTSAGGKC